MAARNFPPVGSQLRTPPLYHPEAWAIRYLDLGTENVRREEWRKYPNLKACNLGLKSWHPGSHRAEDPLRWRYNPWRAEIWEYLGAYEKWVIYKIYEIPAGGRFDQNVGWTK